MIYYCARCGKPIPRGKEMISPLRGIMAKKENEWST